MGKIEMVYCDRCGTKLLPGEYSHYRIEGWIPWELTEEGTVRNVELRLDLCVTCNQALIEMLAPCPVPVFDREPRGAHAAEAKKVGRYGYGI